MRIREVYNSRIPKLLGVGAIVLYPFILYADREPHASIRFHEFVHIKQIEKLGAVRFYLSYLLYYYAHRTIGVPKERAYFIIPHEIEAYEATEYFIKNQGENNVES